MRGQADVPFERITLGHHGHGVEAEGGGDEGGVAHTAVCRDLREELPGTADSGGVDDPGVAVLIVVT